MFHPVMLMPYAVIRGNRTGLALVHSISFRGVVERGSAANE